MVELAEHIAIRSRWKYPTGPTSEFIIRLFCSNEMGAAQILGTAYLINNHLTDVDRHSSLPQSCSFHTTAAIVSMKALE